MLKQSFQGAWREGRAKVRREWETERKWNAFISTNSGHANMQETETTTDLTADRCARWNITRHVWVYVCVSVCVCYLCRYRMWIKIMRLTVNRRTRAAAHERRRSAAIAAASVHCCCRCWRRLVTCQILPRTLVVGIVLVISCNDNDRQIDC